MNFGRTISCSYLAIFILFGIYDKCRGLELEFAQHQPLLIYANDECTVVTLLQREDDPKEVEVRIESSNPGIAAVTPDEDVLREKSTLLRAVKICGLDAGHVTITATVYDNEDSLSASLPVIVCRGRVWQAISYLSSWMYCLCWSFSALFQIRTNYACKSVTGLNLDFVLLNLTGLFLQVVFTSARYISSAVQDVYQSIPEVSCPVTSFDLISSWLGFLGILFISYQCCVYKRGAQVISLAAKILVFLYVVIVAILALSTYNTNYTQQWRSTLRLSSYIILPIVIIQYVPQVIMIYSRKSTIGWSIDYVKLVFLGSIFRILQLIVCSYNYADWESISNHLVSFGASITSVVFGALFIFLHYVLYRHPYIEVSTFIE